MNKVTVTFRVSDGVFGRSGFKSFEGAEAWFEASGLEWANVTVERSLFDGRSASVTSHHVHKFDKRPAAPRFKMHRDTVNGGTFMERVA